MNILYCGDSNIVDGLIISILSLIKHESGDLNIYVFSMDYEDKKSVSEKAIKTLDKITFIIGFILICIIRRNKYTKVGTPTALYLIIYGLIRFFIERSRTDALMLAGFRIAMIVSVIMVIVGVVMLIINIMT